MNGIDMTHVTLISQKEFAGIIGRKPSTIEWLSDKYEDFPRIVRIGRRKCYRLVDVKRWLETRVQEAGIVLEAS